LPASHGAFHSRRQPESRWQSACPHQLAPGERDHGHSPEHQGLSV
jgi:hypothetical protein